MTTVQRYLTWDLLKVFFFVMVVNTTLMAFIGVFQQANDLGLDAAFTLRLIPYIIPTMLPFTIPAGLLLSVIIVYGRISNDNEIVAIKSAGISPGVLLWPAVLVGITTSLMTLTMMNHTIPWASRQIQKIVINGMEEIVFKKLTFENHFSLGEISIYVSSVENKTLIFPIIKYTNAKQEYVLTAEAALLSIDSENGVIDLTLKNATIETAKTEKGADKVTLQGTTDFKLKLPTVNRKRLGYHMTGKEVNSKLIALANDIEFERERIAISAIMGLTQADFQSVVNSVSSSHSERTESQIRKLSTEKHGRFAMAASCLIFVLVGSTLASINAASHYLLSFLYCFLPTVCIYYPIVLGSIALSQSGTLPAHYAVWIGNGLSCFVVIFLVRKYYHS